MQDLNIEFSFNLIGKVLQTQWYIFIPFTKYFTFCTESRMNGQKNDQIFKEYDFFLRY